MSATAFNLTNACANETYNVSIDFSGFTRMLIEHMSKVAKRFLNKHW